MSSTPGKKRRLLSTAHILLVLALGGWWLLYLWRHTPAREIFRAKAEHRRRTSDAFALDIPMDAVEAAVGVVVGDLAFGALTLALFGLGTHLYVRRLEIWLGARTSGEAISFGASELESQAIIANEDRGKVAR